MPQSRSTSSTAPPFGAADASWSALFYDRAVDAERSFDLLAASLRADATDMRAFVQALAAKLEGSFPEHVRIERGGFLGDKHVRRLEVELGESRYELEANRGDVECRRRAVVRGISLKTEELPLDEWIGRLSAELLAVAERSERGRAALEQLLSDPDAYRSFGFPAADELGNMSQFKRDFEDAYVGARDLEVARSLDPQLQDFDAWLAREQAQHPTRLSSSAASDRLATLGQGRDRRCRGS